MYKCKNCGSENIKCAYPDCYLRCQDCGNDVIRGIGIKIVKESGNEL